MPSRVAAASLTVLPVVRTSSIKAQCLPRTCFTSRASGPKHPLTFAARSAAGRPDCAFVARRRINARGRTGCPAACRRSAPTPRPGCSRAREDDRGAAAPDQHLGQRHGPRPAQLAASLGQQEAQRPREAAVAAELQPLDHEVDRRGVDEGENGPRLPDSARPPSAATQPRSGRTGRAPTGSDATDPPAAQPAHPRNRQPQGRRIPRRRPTEVDARCSISTNRRPHRWRLVDKLRRGFEHPAQALPAPRAAGHDLFRPEPS